MQAAVARVHCNTVEQPVTRALRLVCSALACVAAVVVFAVATLCALPASTQRTHPADVLLAALSLPLLVLCAWSFQRAVAAAARLWMVLLALLSLGALAFTSMAQGARGLTVTQSSAPHVVNPTVPFVGSLAVLILASQIAGRLARAGDCACD